MIRNLNSPLPVRVRLLVLGGSVQGLGVLHDIASRGWRDVHLVEKGKIGYGTNMRTAKFFHEELFFSRHLMEMVFGTTDNSEKQMLINMIGDLIKPIEIIFAVNKTIPQLLLKSGLSIQEIFLRKRKEEKNHSLSEEEVKEKAPILAYDGSSKYFSYWDAQIDSLTLVERVANSAIKLGAGITENCEALKIWPCDDGWEVEVRSADGNKRKISALYVVNCLGSNVTGFLEKNNINPDVKGVYKKTNHLMIRDLGLKAGVLLPESATNQTPYLFPWRESTIIGTTEEVIKDPPSDIQISSQDVESMLLACNQYLKKQITYSQVITGFSGIKWYAFEKDERLLLSQKPHVIGERSGGRGLLLCVYQGKFSLYRKIAKIICDRIAHHFGEHRPSQTNNQDFWSSKPERDESIKNGD